MASDPWQRKETIGDAELYLGDCLEVLPTLGKVDAVVTDPPYGTTACKWDACIPFDLMWKQLKRITKKNGAIVLFGRQPFTSALVMSNPKMFKYEWVWEKDYPTNPIIAKKQVMSRHENILVFYEKQSIYNSQMIPREKGKFRNNKKKTYLHRIMDKDFTSTRTGNEPMVYPHSIQKFNRDRKESYHPAQKPVALMEYLIKTYTNEGEIVLDFTMGSGTTGVACRNLNRSFIGIELDPTYFDIACRRIEKAWEQRPLLFEPEEVQATKQEELFNDADRDDS